MNAIGPLVERRRRQLGMTRGALAGRLGVSSQTVLNIERDANYNLGLHLVTRLEEALAVEFEVVMKEHPMSTTIRLGNDDFILYVRKNYPECATTNDQLGKRVWLWLQGQDATARKTHEGVPQPCYWGDTGPHVDECRLPQRATQFEFRRELLPGLYEFLDELART